MWFENSILYQIFPLGFCGVLDREGVEPANRISKVIDWIPHMKSLGVDALYLSPVFESDRHGYDTRDYTKIDSRLGSNKDFAEVCKELQSNGIRVILDGVFNHVGRGFWAFRDVLENRENSRYCGWFNIDFGGDTPCGDGLWYEGWEGHYDLVKLNLRNDEVVQYLLSCVRGWIDEFNIDGIRLDVAYMLDRDYMRSLSSFVKSIKPDFFLLGEIIHGDYNELIEQGHLDSCTNYECYHGLFSSFNTLNMFEIAHSFNRQFGPEDWSLYRDKHLTNFADNHDVNRLASVIENKNHLPLLYGMLFAMPGIPCIYYGSEWGAEGLIHNDNDHELRPSFEKPISNELTAAITEFARHHCEQDAFRYGGYEQIALTNNQIVFMRHTDNHCIFVAVNAADENETLESERLNFTGENLLTGETASFDGRMELPGLSIAYWKAE